MSNGIKYICENDLCAMDNSSCIPKSTKSEDHVGCSTYYYLANGQLIHCNSKICIIQNMVGYFDNVISDDYIKCTSNGTKITCVKLDAPTETKKTCSEAGELLYLDGRNVKLYLDTTSANAIEIFKKSSDNYFIKSDVLNTSLTNNN